MQRILPLACTATLFTLCAALPAQLPAGHYLVGTYGWDESFAPDPEKTTVQLLDPYAGTATQLDVTGLPTNEYPSGLIVESATSFLMSTKDWNSPPMGAVYRVQLVASTWQATQLHPDKLPINATGMVQFGGYVYVSGSGVFGTGGDDAQIWRVPRHGGDAVPHAQFGLAFLPNGAVGVGSGMTLVGHTLHVFTFNSAPGGPDPNEHWAIDAVPIGSSNAASSPSIRRVGLLPLPLRVPPGQDRGFAASGAAFDQTNDSIAVASRWGELAWVDPDSGATLGQAAQPGYWSGAAADELWIGMTYNEDTGALAMGDFDVGVDEFRCDGAPFAIDVVQGLRPSTPGLMGIAGLDYIPTRSSYLPVGNGCPGSSGEVGCSYLAAMPSRDSDVVFTLSTQASSAMLMIGRSALVDLTGVGAPGCVLGVDPYVTIPVTVVGGIAMTSVQLPRTARGKAQTQWTMLDPVNSLGLVLSDARELRVR